jgi:hypothetical protein
MSLPCDWLAQSEEASFNCPVALRRVVLATGRLPRGPRVVLLPPAGCLTAPVRGLASSSEELSGNRTGPHFEVAGDG